MERFHGAKGAATTPRHPTQTQTCKNTCVWAGTNMHARTHEIFVLGKLGTENVGTNLAHRAFPRRAKGTSYGSTAPHTDTNTLKHAKIYLCVGRYKHAGTHA